MPEPIIEKGKIPSQKPEPAEPEKTRQEAEENPLAELHQQVGNRAVRRLIQREGGGESEVDEETADRIDANRGGGQELDAGVQESMGEAMGTDFSDVRVHTSSESDELNTQLGAKAFTTGSDVFFSDGAYDPDTVEGRELLAHELTHVVQQGGGAAEGGGPMTVNEPGDAHEQEADSVAETISKQGVQKQEDEELDPAASIEEEDLPVQMQEEEELEEEELPVQMQEEEFEEEEALQRQIEHQDEEEEQEL